MFPDDELRGLAACATKGVFNCERFSAQDMVMQIFQPEGKQAKDWDGKSLYSVRDEIDNFINLVMSQKPGEAIVRIDPDTQPYFLNVPLVPDPKCSPELEAAFRLAVAKRWYRPKQ
jgi:hypothetical protein